MRKKKKTAIFLIIIDVCMIICFFLAYGPFSYLRELYITTAMTTMSHKYLARTIYTEDIINDVLDGNYVKETGESTNTNDIVIGDIDDSGEYDSIYDEQILTRDPAHPEYKLIPLKGNGYQGYMVAIYDPSRVELVMTNKLGRVGQFLRELVVDNQAILGMNASGFVDQNEMGNGGEPTGIVIQDGKVIWDATKTGYSGGIAGFTKDNKLVLTKGTAEEAIKAGVEDAVEFGPFLIVNGKAAEIKGNGGWGVAPRTVLAQRKDGIVLFVVIDGRQPGYSLGISMNELTKLLQRYKAHNAVNLDGGASSSISIGNETITKPCGYSATGERRIPNAWVLK
jgi:exopolysaccharide biosynthesis protein